MSEAPSPPTADDWLSMLKTMKAREWNAFRHAHPDWSPDLGQANLQGCELQRFDLSGARLDGAQLGEDEEDERGIRGFLDSPCANMHSANLRGASLVGASLRGVLLNGSDLREVKARGADFTGAFLSATKLERADLRYAKCSGAMFHGAGLQAADLGEVDLSRAELHTADLSGASLRGACAQGADLSNAVFLGADLGGLDLAGCNVAGVVYSRQDLLGKCTGVRGLASVYGDLFFVRDLREQDYLDSLASRWRGTWRMQCLYRPWSWIDYGRSLGRVAFAGIVAALIFGAIFLVLDLTDARALAYAPHTPDNYFTPFYYSIVTFTTLGFGDVTPCTLAGQILVVLEVVLGYLTLGLLISVLANKVAQRG